MNGSENEEEVDNQNNQHVKQEQNSKGQKSVKGDVPNRENSDETSSEAEQYVVTEKGLFDIIGSVQKKLSDRIDKQFSELMVSHRPKVSLGYYGDETPEHPFVSKRKDAPKTSKLAGAEDLRDMFDDSTRPLHNVRPIPQFNSQPTFSGKADEDLETWLFTLNQNFELVNVPISKRVLCASTYLRGNANLEFQRWTKESGSLIWFEFEKRLRDTYIPSNNLDILFDKIRKLYQSSTVRKYTDEFKSYVGHFNLTVMSEFMRTRFYVGGLSSKIRNEVNFKKPKNLNEAISLALEYELYDPASKASEINAFFKTNYKNEIKCSKCK